ncbi:uncharacterized protein [Aristolochia californica]|uniref:uncharacterized protein n=1 Tax=Aristolochia californica TaxID=171875 RepID=UPI0035DB57E1
MSKSKKTKTELGEIARNRREFWGKRYQREGEGSEMPQGGKEGEETERVAERDKRGRNEREVQRENEFERGKDVGRTLAARDGGSREGDRRETAETRERAESSGFTEMTEAAGTRVAVCENETIKMKKKK